MPSPHKHEITLRKPINGVVHTYVFRYAPLQESILLSAITDAVKADCGLDWMDAAAIAYRMNQKIDEPDYLHPELA